MKTLYDLFESLNTRGQAPAFVYRTGIRRFVFSYHELYTFALKMAQLLKERDVGRGDRILLWAPNSPWWAIAFWGAVVRGAVVVPVDFTSGRERAEAIARASGSKLIIQSQYKLDKIETKNFFLIEDIEYLLDGVAPARHFARAQPDDVVELVYTSGTTGDPKGVVLTHKNLITNLIQLNKHIPVITSQWQFLSLLPLSHMLEQMAGFLVPLSQGATIVYIRTLKPSAMMEAFAKEDIYAAILVPRLLQLLKSGIEREIGHKHLETIFLWLLKKTSGWSRGAKRKIFFPVHKKFGPRFSLFVSGGAMLDLEVRQFWSGLGFKILEGYGLTECSPVLTAHTFEKQIAGSVGRALSGVKLAIKEGEILAKGNNVFSGYYRNEVATREAFTEDGWFRTGDFGLLDADGNLFIKGRKKEMIATSAGVKVFPDDVERVLNKLSGVRESCVVGIKGSSGEEVHAVLILNSGVKPEKIIKEANEKLDPLQQITGFSEWRESEFPKTTTLKIKRFQVQEEIIRGQKHATLPSQDKLIYLISKVTGKPPEEITESSILTADLGLTSIARLELASFIEQEFRLDMEDTFITQHTTVVDLRAFIAKRERYGNTQNLRLWTTAHWVGLVRHVADAILQIHIFRFLMKLKIHGFEQIEQTLEKTPVLFIANHVSYFDHPVIYYALPPRYRYRTATAAWEEFFFKDNNPLKRLWKRFAYEYGTLFFNLFTLPQERGFGKTLEHMGKLVDRGVNVLIFPEGERSLDGAMLPFKAGLGLMVKELKVPVIPIKIVGMEKIFPVGASFPKPGRVSITFGKPLYFKQESPSEIVAKSRQAIMDL